MKELLKQLNFETTPFQTTVGYCPQRQLQGHDLQKSVLQNLAKVIGKQLCRSFYLIKFRKLFIFVNAILAYVLSSFDFIYFNLR